MPPYETNGNGRPVTGMMPIVIPMFSNTWNANQLDTRREQSPGDVVRRCACRAMAQPRQMTIASNARMTPAPSRRAPPPRR